MFCTLLFVIVCEVEIFLLTLYPKFRVFTSFMVNIWTYRGDSFGEKIAVYLETSFKTNQ